MGCLSCKRLKIKCNEARPVCEYCSYRGRRCVYPDSFQVSKDPVKPDVWDYYVSMSSSTDLTPIEDEIFSESRSLTFQMLLGSTADSLQLSRFELRVVRFFNDVCVPFMTYNVNKRHVYVWEKVIPRYFTSSSAIRSAVLAMGCLTIMPLCGLGSVLNDKLNADELTRELGAASETWKVQRLFADDHLFEGAKLDINLFTRASEYFGGALNGSHEALMKYQSPDRTKQEKLVYLNEASISNYLIYSFLALQPWKLIPLVSFAEDGYEPKNDLLNVAMGLKTIVFSDYDLLITSDIGDLFHADELHYVPSRKVKFVEDLKNQFNDYLGGIGFFDISSEKSAFINDIRHCLSFLEKAFILSVKFNYPVNLYKWLVMISPQFVPYVREKNFFALRLLYAYACICIHVRLWSFEHSVWRDYIVWFRNKYWPLYEFDERLFHYVITKKRYINDENFQTLKYFDVWSQEFDY
ncbi:hypothetical protein FDK38_002182 [Candidozyma auris]|nr:hypothetical protein FDK38_002182 [[Candida] auris]